MRMGIDFELLMGTGVMTLEWEGLIFVPENS